MDGKLGLATLLGNCVKSHGVEQSRLELVQSGFGHGYLPLRCGVRISLGCAHWDPLLHGHV